MFDPLFQTCFVFLFSGGAGNRSGNHLHIYTFQYFGGLVVVPLCSFITPGAAKLRTKVNKEVYLWGSNDRLGNIVPTHAVFRARSLWCLILNVWNLSEA